MQDPVGLTKTIRIHGKHEKLKRTQPSFIIPGKSKSLFGGDLTKIAYHYKVTKMIRYKMTRDKAH